MPKCPTLEDDRGNPGKAQRAEGIEIVIVLRRIAPTGLQSDEDSGKITKSEEEAGYPG